MRAAVFRFRVPPRANRLYNLMRRGTMSAPAPVLSEFWADLREKSRVRIEHPDSPKDRKRRGTSVLNCAI